MRILWVACAALALSVGVATATAGGGSSDAAKACQKDGYNNWVRQDGSSFKNTGDCVSYAAHGGALVRKSQSQIDCESFGGTFSTDPSTNQTTFPIFFWSCLSYPDLLSDRDALGHDCLVDGGQDFIPFVDPASSESSSCVALT